MLFRYGSKLYGDMKLLQYYDLFDKREPLKPLLGWAHSFKPPTSYLSRQNDKLLPLAKCLVCGEGYS